MKKPLSKTDLRQRLARHTAAFLSGGGTVKKLNRGESAYDKTDVPPAAPLFEARPSNHTTRTPLTDVIAALEARRATKRSRTRAIRRKTPERSKKVFYDDFGEPLRVTWVEE